MFSVLNRGLAVRPGSISLQAVRTFIPFKKGMYGLCRPHFELNTNCSR